MGARIDQTIDFKMQWHQVLGPELKVFGVGEGLGRSCDLIRNRFFMPRNRWLMLGDTWGIPWGCLEDLLLGQEDFLLGQGPESLVFGPWSFGPWSLVLNRRGGQVSVPKIGSRSQFVARTRNLASC